jgi:hypothetical protein
VSGTGAEIMAKFGVSRIVSSIRSAQIAMNVLRNNELLATAMRQSEKRRYARRLREMAIEQAERTGDTAALFALLLED